MLTPEAALFLTVSAFMVILVPAEVYPKLFPPGLTFGLLLPLLGAMIGSGLGLRVSDTAFIVAHFDIWFLYAWIPLTVIYLHYLPRRWTWQFWSYLFTFTVFSTINWITFQHAHRIVTRLSWGAVFPLFAVGYFAAAYLSPYLIPGAKEK